MITPKELKQLARACRRAGIKSFKSKEFEFTLTDDAPPVSYYLRTKKKEQPEKPTTEIVSDMIPSGETMTEEQMLFWSAGVLSEGNVTS